MESSEPDERLLLTVSEDKWLLVVPEDIHANPEVILLVLEVTWSESEVEFPEPDCSFQLKLTVFWFHTYTLFFVFALWKKKEKTNKN